MFKLIIQIFILCLLIYPPALHAQHGHTHAEEEMANAHLISGMFSVYAESQKYELTLKHSRIDPDEEGELTLYIADFMTNRPLDSVELNITVQEDPSIIIQTEPHDAGIYHLHVSFPEAKAYSLAVSLNSKEHGADLMLLRNVEIGKDPPVEETAEAAIGHEHSDWWKYVLVFLGGLLIGILFLRRRPKAVAGILIVLSVHAIISEANAHEGHDDEEKGTAGNTVMVPKETQFLFNILTQALSPGEFQPSAELFATVIPSPGGFANITTPQSGRILSLNITPGQIVREGQVLGSIRLSTSLSEQVGVATETGRLRAEIRTAEAELKAAEGELNRLRSIEDIAAKKDIQAAEARYAAAKANLESLRSIASGSVTATSGTLTLKAPVTGTIGQFSFSEGSEVIEGTTLFSVINLDKVYLEAQAFSDDADMIRNASRFQVVSSRDQRASDQLRLVSAGLEFNPANQSQKVLFELTNPKGEFKIGEFVTVRAFQAMSEKTAFVPNSALSEINGKPVLFVKDNPENYTVRYISLGEDNGTHTVVLNGLDQGERYVTEGTYQVKMMMLNQ